MPVVGAPRSNENIGRNAVDNGRRISLASALVGHKEEGFVFPDRASQYASKNIPPQQRAPEASGLQEWIVRVERFVPEILISVPMDFIAAALSHKLDVGAAAPTIRGVIEGSLHFEFLNGFRSWNLNQNWSLTAHRGCINAVYLKIVLRNARAVNGNGLRIAADTSAVWEIASRPWRKSQNLREIAGGQGELRNGPRAHHASKLWPIHVQKRRRTVHNNRLEPSSQP